MERYQFLKKHQKIKKLFLRYVLTHIPNIKVSNLAHSHFQELTQTIFYLQNLTNRYLNVVILSKGPLWISITQNNQLLHIALGQLNEIGNHINLLNKINQSKQCTWKHLTHPSLQNRSGSLATLVLKSSSQNQFYHSCHPRHLISEI